MDVLNIITAIGSILGVIATCTVLIAFVRTTRKDIKQDVKADVEESTAYAVNQQHMLNDLKEIKVQLISIGQKNETNFQMAVRQEERQNQTEKRLDNLEVKIEQVYMLINRQGGSK